MVWTDPEQNNDLKLLLSSEMYAYESSSGLSLSLTEKSMPPTLSSLYEFGAEASFEEPSIQDLIVTPGVGYFIGKYFVGVRADILKKPTAQLKASDKFVLVMTDPVGAMNEVVDDWFGNKVQASLQPMLGPQYRSSVAYQTRFEEGRPLTYLGNSDLGMKLTLRW